MKSHRFDNHTPQLYTPIKDEIWGVLPETYMRENGIKGSVLVSNLGRVRSLDRTILYTHWCGRVVSKLIRGQVYRQGLNDDGYFRCGMGVVHRLVALVFIPNPENCPCVNHKDGNKTNNDPTNLEWVTVKENTQHAVRNGLHAFMRGNKLTPEDIPVILDRIARGDDRRQIAADYGVKSVARIRTGETWTRIVRAWEDINGKIKNKTWKKKAQSKGR